ncbi:MAG: ergothioneine biosynthesis protein EgtB [Acidobacteriota bacterium]
MRSHSSVNKDQEMQIASCETVTASLSAKYQQVRLFTEYLCQPLAIEDYVIQSMPDVSPTKWHLAHTSWFFETFLLAAANPDYQPYNKHYNYLFNSYYVAVGDRYCRAQRGLLSRPTVAEIYDYRHYIDEHIMALLAKIDTGYHSDLAARVELGLHHEQQHQELLLTDIKHVYSLNPLQPIYQPREQQSNISLPALSWQSFLGGLHWIGNSGKEFVFDNECPRHRVFIAPFQLATRLITNGEYLNFIEDGGYCRPELWLSDGWYTVQTQQWQAPLYWQKIDECWWQMTLSGLSKVYEAEPVCHVSFYEADAYARWAGARLPSEAEWEVATTAQSQKGNFVEAGNYHPVPLTDSSDTLTQMFGDVWEWTQSHYSPYPGYYPPAGALGEYNGKFMCNQFVLRGGSCATSAYHIRPTYRNFFPAQARWQFTGIRLAKETVV